MLPSLLDVVDAWEADYDRTYDPHDWFAPLSQALQRYRAEFATNPAAIEIIDKALRRIESVVDDLVEERVEYDDDREPFDFVNRASVEQDRGVFDDIDE